MCAPPCCRILDESEYDEQFGGTGRTLSKEREHTVLAQGFKLESLILAQNER